jgi:hypothetical protein
VDSIGVDALRDEALGQAWRDRQHCLSRALPPFLDPTAQRLQRGRAEVADGQRVAETRVDGEDQREAMQPGRGQPDGEDG